MFFSASGFLWKQRLALHWRMTRPSFLLITVAACLLGLASAAFDGVRLNAALAVLTLVLAGTAHAGANVLNDFYDARSGADALNLGRLAPFTGGSGLIQRGAVTPAHTGLWAAILLLAVVVPGLWLVLRSGLGLFGLGLAGLFMAWAYSAPPLQLMARGASELTVACAWGLMVVGADYTQRQQWATLPAALGLGFGLLVACILLINSFPDAAADARVGKRTLVVRLGPRRAAGLYAVLAVLAHATPIGPVALGSIPWPVAAWGLASLPCSLLAAGLLWRWADAPARLRPAIVLTIVAALVHALALAGALCWARPTP